MDKQLTLSGNIIKWKISGKETNLIFQYMFDDK